MLTQTIVWTETAREPKNFMAGGERAMNPARAVHGLLNDEEEAGYERPV